MSQPTVFVLLVSSLQGSATFFRDVMACTIHGVVDPDWLCFRRDGYEFMVKEWGDCLRQTGGGSDPGVMPRFAYLAVPNVIDDYRRAVAHGVPLFKSLRDEPWGRREFGLCTADGHRIMMGQDLSP